MFVSKFVPPNIGEVKLMFSNKNMREFYWGKQKVCLIRGVK